MTIEIDRGCMGDSQDPDRNHCYHDLDDDNNTLICCFCGEITKDDP